MKKEILPSLLLSLVCLVFFCGVYPAIVWGIGQFADGKGKGVTIKGANGKVYYENIAQKFTDDKYFWSRPSAVDYNAAGSGGSNKGPNNPEYLAVVQARIDTFVVHNPGVKRSDIPSDLVTASGSGLDPHISVQGAMVQVQRVAKVRGIEISTVTKIVEQNVEQPLAGLFGPKRVNVLKLNIDLDKLAAK